MTALAPKQLPLELPPHRNHYLFSGYYLDNRVQERPEWQAADAEAQAALATLTALWQQIRPETRNLNESQTEQQWIQPALDALGHRNSYNVQVSIETSRGTKKPDYIFYPGPEHLKAAQQRGGVFAESDLVPALAVGDAKAWGRSLDVAAKGARTLEQEISANPSVQIDFYIRHTGRPWGILTDGQYWRLYHRDTSKKLDVYYEVDLLALLEAGDLNAFKFFYLFFRRDAFTTGWLQAVLDESHSYERGVSKNLRDQVYEALRELAQGFLDYTPNGLQPTPETLRAIYDNSLIVLYRLLFILYAESRDLLPLKENAAYRESYSLDAIKNRIARDEQQGRRAVPSVASLWAELRGLWTVLNEGNAHLGVPAYNGGLFNPERHPFLEQHRVGDAHLRAAIDGLARVLDPETGRREFVDYRDLEVRHLGSIYEGLLEYNLQVGEDRRVALLTDKGERKATGSYYTPDYIVQYIVEQAVGPLLDALEEQHQPEGSDEGKVNFARAVLNLNVLDPATGSGHFLVAATDFIARRLVEQEVDTTQGLEGEAALNYWRRRVVQSCIYGVDLNPLAIELAKLSLWLNTVARDKPLSFLDHHLRAGNSLVGARVADLGIGGPPQSKKKKPTRKQEREQREALEAGQQSMLEDEVFLSAIRDATGFMEQIEALRSDTLDEVHEAERIYREQVRAHTAKYRALADVWTARHFGLGLDDTLWAGLVQHTLRGGFDLPRYAEAKEQARAVAGQHRFFHWELEFPEVFFNERGQVDEQTSGFDAVIGNPPYVRQEQLSPLKPYFAQTYENVYSGTADLFVYFFGQGLRLLRQDARLSYISSNSWLRANYATSLRAYLRSEITVETLVDLGDNRVFADAPDVYPAIPVVRRTLPPVDYVAQAAILRVLKAY
ncbi:MAG TPA: N-6 DNA methylase [Ardenticatenaceae bacterium]